MTQDLPGRVKYVMRVYFCEWCDVDDLDESLRQLADDIGVYDQLDLAKDDGLCAALDAVVLSEGLPGSTKVGVKRIDLFRASCVNAFKKLDIADKLESWPGKWRDQAIRELAATLAGEET